MYNPNKNDEVLVAVYTEHKYQIIDLRNKEKDIQYSEHGSLAYGCDWKYSEQRQVASISFYDSQIHLWQP
mgnify:CR=1 FL=1